MGRIPSTSVTPFSKKNSIRKRRFRENDDTTVCDSQRSSQRRRQRHLTGDGAHFTELSTSSFVSPPPSPSSHPQFQRQKHQHQQQHCVTKPVFRSMFSNRHSTGIDQSPDRKMDTIAEEDDGNRWQLQRRRNGEESTIPNTIHELSSVPLSTRSRPSATLEWWKQKSTPHDNIEIKQPSLTTDPDRCHVCCESQNNPPQKNSLLSYFCTVTTALPRNQPTGKAIVKRGGVPTAVSTCQYCDRRCCGACTQICERCKGSYCTFCSNIDYSGPVERTFCPDCEDGCESVDEDVIMDMR